MVKVTLNKDKTVRTINVKKGESLFFVVIEKDGKKHTGMKIERKFVPEVIMTIRFYDKFLENGFIMEMTDSLNARIGTIPGKAIEEILKEGDKNASVYIG